MYMLVHTIRKRCIYHIHFEARFGINDNFPQNKDYTSIIIFFFLRMHFLRNYFPNIFTIVNEEKLIEFTNSFL